MGVILFVAVRIAVNVVKRVENAGTHLRIGESRLPAGYQVMVGVEQGMGSDGVGDKQRKIDDFHVIRRASHPQGGYLVSPVGVNGIAKNQRRLHFHVTALRRKQSLLRQNKQTPGCIIVIVARLVEIDVSIENDKIVSDDGFGSPPQHDSMEVIS